MKEKVLDCVLLILKLLLPLLLLIPLVIFSVGLIETRLFDLSHLGEAGYHSGYMFYFFATTLLLLAINVGVLVLTGVARLIVAFCKESPKKERHARFFHLFFWAPPANQLLYVLLLIVLSVVT